MTDGLSVGPDGVTRCWWCGDDPLYVRYHDTEWGRPVRDDHRLYVVSRFGEADVERLLGDAGIVRHRGKIASTINNAQRALELIDEFGSIATFLDRFVPAPQPAPTGLGQIPAKTAESTAISKELKRRGWSFVGPTTVYAFMQSMGLVNDHLAGCSFRHP